MTTAAQFGRVFKNLGSVLKGVGSDFDGVIKFTAYLSDSKYIDQFMELRSALFPKLF